MTSVCSNFFCIQNYVDVACAIQSGNEHEIAWSRFYIQITPDCLENTGNHDNGARYHDK